MSNDYQYDIYQLLDELEDRIPDLFVGKSCPGNCFCSCSYESGCRLLTKSESHVILLTEEDE